MKKIKDTSSVDLIGDAINEITSSVSYLKEQHETSIQYQLGKSKLSDILRGEKSLEEFVDVFFNFCADYQNIQIGTFYYVDQSEQLKLIKSFGTKKSPQAQIALDEPFYKNIIAKSEPLMVEGLRPDFFNVDTSFGTLPTGNLLIVPLYFNNNIAGLVELGKFDAFTDFEISFWKSTANSIGIYLNTLFRKLVLQNLLAELDFKEQQLQNQINAINRTAISVEFDINGNVLNANDLFFKNMGYSREEIIGKHHRMFVDPKINYDEHFNQMWSELKEAHVITGEHKRITKKGEEIWFYASYNPVVDNLGNIYKVLKVGFDITRSKQQQLEIEGLTLKMDQQIDVLNSAAIVSETDAKGNITFVNDYFCKISEYSREELIGKNHKILKSGKQPDGLFVGMWKAISEGLTWQGEILNKSKSGKFYWVWTTIKGFKNREGEIEKYVAIRFDITKEKAHDALKKQTELLMEAQRELELSNTELEAQTQKLQASEEELRVQQEELLQSNQELAEKTKLLIEKNRAYNEKNDLLVAATADLKKKAEQLEISSKYKSEFLANMSHELRTPLNSILLLSKLMIDNFEGNLSPDQIEYSTVINKAGTSLLELINDILDISKIESGKMDINPEIFELKDFEKEIRDLFVPLSNDKSIEFITTIDENCPDTLFTDRFRLGQVIKNLLSNAFKFTANGKVAFTIKMQDYGAIPKIALSVVDNGIGIPKEKHALVFEAFQQADGSTKRKYGGTGLGLSISREIAHLLGGEISLESEVGKGSNFTITIPATYNAEIIESKEPKVSANVNKTQVPERVKTPKVDTQLVQDDRYTLSSDDKAILIIEDDVHFSKALQVSAKQAGYKVITAFDGGEGIALAKSHKPSGIILDLNLPVTNGWEVMKELKADASTKGIPVHIVTAEDVDVKLAKESGAFDFSSKPLMESDLKQLFQNLAQLNLKQDGKIALLADKDEHSAAIRSFMAEKYLDVTIYPADNDATYPDNFSIFDAVIVDVDSRKSKIVGLLERLKNRVSGNKLPVIVLSRTYLSSIDTKRIMKYEDAFSLKIVKSYSGILAEISGFLSLVANEAMVKKMRPAIIPAKVLEGKYILVVDDDAENRFSIGKLLEAQKANVILAENGIEALEIFKGRHQELSAVLMDIMMPDMDGYEVMREIRKTNEGKKLPIIALTAKTQPDERENCLKHGASDYLPKPVDGDSLISLLRVWVNQNNGN